MRMLMIFGLATLFLLDTAEAQQSTKLPRIGYISGTGNATDQGPYVEALRHGLRDLGHIEGRTFVMEFRGAEGKTDRYPTLVNELVQLKVAVLIVPTLPSVLIAKEATKS